MSNGRGGSRIPDGSQTPLPAGWYPDPEYPEYERYFDGVAWTGYRRPIDPQHPYFQQPDPQQLGSQHSHSQQLPAPWTQPPPQLERQPESQPQPVASSPYETPRKQSPHERPREQSGPVQFSGRREPRTPTARRTGLTVGVVLLTVVAMAVVAVLFFSDWDAKEGSLSETDAARYAGRQELIVSSTDVAYFSAGETGARWSGGMVIGDPRVEDDEITHVPIWVPGMEDFTTCELELTEPEEIVLWIAEPGVDVAAPLRPDITEAYVAFGVITGDGEKAEVDIFVRTLDPQTCEMGPRRKLVGPVDLEDVLLSRPQFFGGNRICPRRCSAW